MAGAKPIKEKKIYKGSFVKIRNLTSSYNVSDNLHFVKDVAYNLSSLQMYNFIEIRI